MALSSRNFSSVKKSVVEPVPAAPSPVHQTLEHLPSRGPSSAILNRLRNVKPLGHPSLPQESVGVRQATTLISIGVGPLTSVPCCRGPSLVCPQKNFSELVVVVPSSNLTTTLTPNVTGVPRTSVLVLATRTTIPVSRKAVAGTSSPAVP